jgi:FtsP/CotA-like multicopper oxidase with cupredoxin domain
MRASRLSFIALLCVAGVALGGARPVARRHSSERIAPNDNEHSAGRLQKGVLTVAMEARRGEWRPEESAGATYNVIAFAVAGGQLQVPGPVLRAPVGTDVHVSIHNTLATPMWVHGLGAHRGSVDAVEVAAGATREIRFLATAPGLFYYSARTTPDSTGDPAADETQLGGAIVIDPPGVIPADRIFLISKWDTLDSTTVSGLGPNSIITFNGLGWPHTPRIDVTQGDTVHWRFINATSLEHPLHLHGAYFRVDAKGDGKVDSTFAPDDRRMAVTELLLPGQTMSMTWTPVHSGNWILHCHLGSHITPRAMLESDRRMPMRAADAPPMPRDDAHVQHMAGLVLGIRVHPRGAQLALAPVSRRIRLLVRSRARVYGDYPGYGFVLGDSLANASRDSFSTPGPTLELTRGQRVAITIVNQAHEPAAVHWHGLELESFPDGVPGWSGWGKTMMPHIMPGDSLTVRFTPTRSGTFMYHSHANEMQQIASGLYGAIIVREPGAVRDPDERTLLFSDDGPTINLFAAGPPELLNGKLVADTIDVRAGKPTRLRLINIRAESATELALEQNGAPVQWRVIAKDGADLPPHQIRERPAAMLISPGEIYDVEVAAPSTGTMILRYLDAEGDSTTVRRVVLRAH